MSAGAYSPGCACPTRCSSGHPALSGNSRFVIIGAINTFRTYTISPPIVITQTGDIYAGFDARERGKALSGEWTARFAAYRAAHPELAAEFERRIAGVLPEDFDDAVAAFVTQQDGKCENVATRKASQQAIAAYAARLPEMIGGSADLTGSVFTNWSGSTTVTRQEPGNYVYFGVREFAMQAIANGLAVHGGFIPYTGTFLTFSDYMRNALRMAALMRLRTISVFTHDSIGLGEDGPTHQSVEHAASLRLVPHLDVWRPCDTVETAVAWGAALRRHDGPTALLFTRQGVPFVKRDSSEIAAIHRGGYVLADFALNEDQARAVVIATGSEVSLEAGVTDGWRKYVGAVDDPHAAVVGLDRYGESAPAGDLFKFFGFTAERVTAAVRAVVANGATSNVKE